MTLPLPPHGSDTLTTRLLSSEEAERLKKENASAPRVVVRGADASTVRRLGDGTLTPLEGFMTEDVFRQVLEEERIIVNGKPVAWGIPFSLPVTTQEKDSLAKGAAALLVDDKGEPLGVIEVEDVFKWDKAYYNTKVYGTDRQDHPGARIANDDDREWLVGGKVHVFPWPHDQDNIIHRYTFTPEESRAKLASSGWEAAIAFQTRNPLHRAHEYAMVWAVEHLTRQGIRAGVVLNPLVGETKSDDVPASIRMLTYENLRNHRLLGQGDSVAEIWEKAGYELNDVFDLFALDIKMFYGGPREALMHAIYRQNHGFSHIIIGRKHADAPFDDGTNIWGDFDAQEKFNNLQGELKIKPLNVGFAAYYEELGRVGLIEEYKDRGWKPVTVAGRVLREQLGAGTEPDPRVIRPETSRILIQALRARKAAKEAEEHAREHHLTWHHHAATRDMREELNGHKGVTLWFTGLSGSGKSTLANEVAGCLHERGVRTYVLDGDNIRQGLNKGLGFSAEDRKENIRRIAEVAKLFTDAGIVNLTAFISPYREDRDAARALQPDGGDFLEVFVKADLSVCEERDPKGLYKKARAGQIKGFTGIDDPYEEPLQPEITVETDVQSLEECVTLIVTELEQRGIVPALDEAKEKELANA